MVSFTDVSSERLIRALTKRGFWIAKTSGKHIGMTDGFRKLTIPRHGKLNPYTLKSILRSAGLSGAEFKKLL